MIVMFDGRLVGVRVQLDKSSEGFYNQLQSDPEGHNSKAQKQT